MNTSWPLIARNTEVVRIALEGITARRTEGSTDTVEEDRPVDRPHGCWEDSRQGDPTTISRRNSSMVTDTTEKGLEALITNFPDRQRVAPRRPAGLRTPPLRRPQTPVCTSSKPPSLKQRPSTGPGRRVNTTRRQVPRPPETGDHQPGHHRRTPKGCSARAQRDNPLLRDADPGQHPG